MPEEVGPPASTPLPLRPPFARRPTAVVHNSFYVYETEKFGFQLRYSKSLEKFSDALKRGNDSDQDRLFWNSVVNVPLTPDLRARWSDFQVSQLEKKRLWKGMYRQGDDWTKNAGQVRIGLAP
ncbi:hypothetical protein EVAR_13243_1 [Eumeta japonica]|uniref:Uncharacterized protein n=1 Tax=Eumeta variegata TaxID=151549 RepID=A0A4C1TS86_EUMVA|nr:hypothetical protein EVAR_13243_1 [Eumeta japonica]